MCTDPSISIYSFHLGGYNKCWIFRLSVEAVIRQRLLEVEYSVICQESIFLLGMRAAKQKMTDTTIQRINYERENILLRS